MKKLQSFLVIMLCALFLSGCSEEHPKVATTIYPLTYLVDRIAGNYVEVENISTDTLVQRAQLKEDYKKTLTIKKVCRYYYEFEGAKDEKQEKYKGAIILLAGEKSIEII